MIESYHSHKQKPHDVSAILNFVEKTYALPDPVAAVARMTGKQIIARTVIREPARRPNDSGDLEPEFDKTTVNIQTEVVFIDPPVDSPIILERRKRIIYMSAPVEITELNPEAVARFQDRALLFALHDEQLMTSPSPSTPLRYLRHDQTHPRN